MRLNYLIAPPTVATVAVLMLCQTMPIAMAYAKTPAGPAKAFEWIARYDGQNDRLRDRKRSQDPNPSSEACPSAFA
jgi:hypothetical protein